MEFRLTSQIEYIHKVITLENKFIHMDSQSILNKVMALIGAEKSVKLSGDEYGKLEDGPVVVTDAFQVGNTLMVIDEDGNRTPAPDADHIIYLPTANGQKRFFITTKDGIMTSIHLEDNHNGKPVNASKQDSQMKKELNLQEIDEVKVEGPSADTEIKDEKDVVKKEEEMASEEQRIDSLEEQVNQLRVDIAQLFEAIKGLDKKEDIQEPEMEEDMKKQMMSAPKKFTGAPVEEPVKLGALIQKKTQDTQSRVFARMMNSNFN